jgi:hypothetical protein
MKRQGRLARLEQASGTVRCPHCGGWIGPEARRRAEEEKQTTELWKAATVEELRQVRDIMVAIRTRMNHGGDSAVKGKGHDPPSPIAAH